VGTREKKSIVSFLFISSVLLAGIARAQTPVWSQVFPTINGIGQDIVTDGEGNTYVVAASGDQVSRAIPEGIYLAKIDPRGTIRWSHNRMGTALALDQIGNLFVVTRTPEGTSELTKHGRDGQILWSRPIGPPPCIVGALVATDGGGNIYLGGYHKAPANNPVDQDVCLTKLNPAGAVLWSKSWSTPYNDVPKRIRIDGRNHVYFGVHLAESATPAEGNRLQLIKLDENGNELWGKVLQGHPGSFDHYLIDGEGRSFVIGDSPLPSGGIQITKFAQDGTKQWTQAWNTEGRAHAGPLALDDEGNLYAAGGAYVEKKYSRFFLLKYNPRGALRSAHLEKTTVYDGPTGMALDSAGNLFLTGVTYGGLDESQVQGKPQAFVIKHAPYAPPSFNCLRATTIQEKLICQDDELASFDAAIATAFKTHLARSGNRRRATLEQQTWLREQRNTCTTREQLAAAMVARIDALKAGGLRRSKPGGR